jgi:hypothetical protein
VLFISKVLSWPLDSPRRGIPVLDGPSDCTKALVKPGMVGAGGVEPPSSSVSAICKEPLCGRPFSQVASDRKGEVTQGESWMLDSLEGICPGQAGLEYPATSVPFSKCSLGVQLSAHFARLGAHRYRRHQFAFVRLQLAQHQQAAHMHLDGS